MQTKKQITSIVPKKYQIATEILDYSDLEDFEARLRKLNEQTTAAFFVEALAIYSVLYDGELFAASGLTWRQYKAETGKRLGLQRRDFSDYFVAGKFLSKYGKQLFASGFDPMRAQRKLARANVALGLCGDIDLVIEHLVNDQWEEFKAWYSGLKLLALPGPSKKGKKRHFAILDGKVFVNGREPIKFSSTINAKERADIEQLIAKYFKSKLK